MGSNHVIKIIVQISPIIRDFYQQFLERHGVDIYRQNMQEIHGAHPPTGWIEPASQIEYGDDHEIGYLWIEPTQQKNEDSDHALNDIIYHLH